MATTMATPTATRRRRRGAAAAAGLTLAALFAADCLFRDDEYLILSPRLFGGGRRQLLRSLDAAHARMEELDSESVRKAALQYDDGNAVEESVENDTRDEDGAPSTMKPPPAQPPAPLPAYTLADALLEAPKWEHTFALLVYDPSTDEFVGYHSKHHQWHSSGKKLWASLSHLAGMLRATFPERFRSDRGEFVLAIGSGDYPHVKLAQLPHKGGAPVLMFGSVFRDPTLYPNMIPMPTPGLHLGCFEMFARTGDVCGGFQRAVPPEPESTWEDLIPQVIWRGTDFGYLSRLLRPKLSAPLGNYIEGMVRNRKATVTGHVEKKRAATQVLREQYDRLLPRWKGAVLTAEAELEAEAAGGNQTIAWADIRFSRQMHNGMLAPTKGSAIYQTYDEVSIATGDFLSKPAHAKHRYQIDLGGGGGTSWTGTLDKLSMPGLLFHHVTPTKDYFYDSLDPWVHFIPVAADLSDVREKFEWAESHPAEARRIAEDGTQFVRHLGTADGLGKMFDEMFRTPLRRVIDAYRPVSNDGTGRTWRDVLEESDVVPVVRCAGRADQIASCKSVEGAMDAALQNRMRLPIFVEQ